MSHSKYQQSNQLRNSEIYDSELSYDSQLNNTQFTFKHLLGKVDILNPKAVNQRRQTVNLNFKLRDIVTDCESIKMASQRNNLSPKQLHQQKCLDRLYPQIMTIYKNPIKEFPKNLQNDLQSTFNKS